MSYTSLSTGIHHDPERRLWALVTAQSTYAFGVTDKGLLLNLHWGPRLTSLADLPDPALSRDRSSQEPALTTATEEYPPFGGLRYGETAAKVTFADQTRDLDLRFAAAESGEHHGLPAVIITLRDAVYPLSVELCYKIDVANDLIIRSATFVSEASETTYLERAFSAVWHLPRQYFPRTLTTLAGQWLGETRLQQRPVVAGTTLIEGRRGITGATANPWFAIETQAVEQAGETYFGELAWSGNWVIRVTTDVTGATAIAGGIHEHDFTWRLKSGETFTTPEFVAGFAQDGLNGVRRRLHHYTREQVLPRPQVQQPRPVLYNSWEATFFDVTEEGQRKLAERAARLGVELFVVDDGWFPARNHDHAGLGDWRPDPHKFPHGLTPLAEHVKRLGMQFGLWVEPEMVNADSDLYRAHPDWIYYFPTRSRSEARNQLVLNLAREDVRAYLIETLATLVAENGINFLKWDMNRPISEPGWPEEVQHGGEAREIWVRHVQGVYAVMDALRAHHPDLVIESCSSGGSRADLGILRRTDQIWPSDNTYPEARLFIQEGFSLMLPARVMVAWVTDQGRGLLPIAYRCHVSMLGTLGIGGNLLHWNDEEMNEVAHWIAIYKEIRELVQDGDQYWLLSPHATHGEVSAVEYVTAAADEAVIFAFRHADLFGEAQPRLRLLKLQSEAKYHVEVLGQDSPTYEASGTALMSAGLSLPLSRRPFASGIVRLRKQ
jgi:alpha-galactosidase